MPRPQFVRGLLALFPPGPKGSPIRATSGVDTLGSSAGLGAERSPQRLGHELRLQASAQEEGEAPGWKQFPSGVPHPPARPVAVWINPPKTRAMDGTSVLAAMFLTTRDARISCL